MKDKIAEYINKNKNWLIDKLKEIISIDTINTPPNGNENNGQDVLEKIFKDMNLKIDRFSPDSVLGFKKSSTYLKGRDYTNRDNLVGFTGEGKKNTIIFNGHMDTVPTVFSKWKKTEALKPKLIDGKLYGLGACDMKGGIISSIFALKAIIDLDIPIKGKVVLESVVDEEFGGANGSLACVKRGYRGDFAIITEPTSMDICVSNVSSMVMIIKIIGAKGLVYIGRRNEGINSIILASEIIMALRDYENFLNSLKNKYEEYKDMDRPIRFLFSDIQAGEIGPDKIMTTPEECLIRIYTENYPDINKSEFSNMMVTFLKKYPSINKYIEKGLIIFKEEYRFIEGGSMDLTIGSNKKFINNIIENGKILINKELKISAMICGTDFFTFNNYVNTPVVILGPGGGNCHAPDEYVLYEDLLSLSKIYAGIIYDYCC